MHAVVFFCFLYQLYIYPVDHTRVNEYGLTGEEMSGNVAPPPATEEAVANGGEGEGKESHGEKEGVVSSTSKTTRDGKEGGKGEENGGSAEGEEAQVVESTSSSVHASASEARKRR